MSTATMSDRESAVLDVIYHRRAVRSYRPTAIPAATIRKLLNAAVHAPTAMRLEPWTFVVIQDRALLKSYSDRAKVVLAEETGKHREYLPPSMAPSDDHLERLLADPAFNIFYDAGTLIVICGKPMGTYVVADCWLAAENLMIAAAALDLGTCCIGLAVPLLNTPEVKRELDIPADVTAVAPIIVGLPSGPTPSVSRKPPEILHWAR